MARLKLSIPRYDKPRYRPDLEQEPTQPNAFFSLKHKEFRATLWIDDAIAEVYNVEDFVTQASEEQLPVVQGQQGFVVSSDGAKVSLKLTDNRRGASVSAVSTLVVVDGVLMYEEVTEKGHHRFLYHNDAPERVVTIVGPQDADDEFHPIVFEKLVAAEGGVDELDQDHGTIELSVWKTSVSGKVSKPDILVPSGSQTPVLDKDQLKPEFEHRAVFGQPIIHVPPPGYVTNHRADDGCLATFMFKYRSRKWLETNGIIHPIADADPSDDDDLIIVSEPDSPGSSPKPRKKQKLSTRSVVRSSPSLRCEDDDEEDDKPKNFASPSRDESDSDLDDEIKANIKEKKRLRAKRERMEVKIEKLKLEGTARELKQLQSTNKVNNDESGSEEIKEEEEEMDIGVMRDGGQKKKARIS